MITNEQMNMQCLEGMGRAVRDSKTMTRAQRDEALRLIAFAKSAIEALDVDNVAEARGALKMAAPLASKRNNSN